MTIQTSPGPITIRTDTRIPPGLILACEPVIAHKDGQTFRTLPPSAVWAIQRYVAKRTEER